MVLPTAILQIECSECMRHHNTIGAADRCCSEKFPDFAAFGKACQEILREHPRGSGAHQFSWGKLVEAAKLHGIEIGGDK